MLAPLLGVTLMHSCAMPHTWHKFESMVSRSVKSTGSVSCVGRSQQIIDQCVRQTRTKQLSQLVKLLPVCGDLLPTMS